MTETQLTRPAVSRNGATPPPTRILALDGGGLRGIIPLKVLARLERLAGKPVHELFDIIVGTSTGAIAALSLTAPGPDGRPRNSAEDMVRFYLEGGPQIFPRHGNRTMIDEARIGSSRSHIVQRIVSILGPKRFGNARYLPVGLRSVLTDAMGDCKLSEALTHVMVPSYDMRHARPVVFSSAAAVAGEGLNPTMVEVAMASTAAPTYFPAYRLGRPGEDLYLVDGGLVANNPAQIAYFAALQQAHREGYELDVMLLSIGTGHAPHDHMTYEEIWSRGWVKLAAGILGVIFDASSDITDDLLRELIGWREPTSRYWRLQTELRGVTTYIDDSTQVNLARLARLGDRLATNHHRELVEIAELLTADRVGVPFGRREAATGEPT